MNPANEYVADFVAHMNPLGVLTAADIMAPLDRSKVAAQDRMLGERQAQHADPAGDGAMARNGGEVGVVENGSRRRLRLGRRRRARPAQAPPETGLAGARLPRSRSAETAISRRR